MNKILDTAQIIIDLKLSKYVWGKVTLRINDEFEIRFCRISVKPDGGLWFQPPKLRDFNWACCFAVLEKSDWQKLSDKVSHSFLNMLKDKVEVGELPPSLIEKIESSSKELLTDEDYEKIEQIFNKNTDLNETNSH
ncbi:MAG: hypothetical protein HZA34_02070 [Candidatus Pacebacteria bacterium]|nr:hypothetical protein [Candidatus Paceibacterota bacterium]